MKYRTFGNTGMKVSEISLGTWQIGSEWGEEVDDDTAQNLLAKAVESGVNFFDTADIYGLGKSESRIARFLKTTSNKIFIATKMGLHPEPGGMKNFSLDVFRKHTEASLKHLNVESLDLTQLHCPPLEVIRTGEVFDWFGTLQKEGKIQHFGVSVETLEEGLACLEHKGPCSLQIIFNIVRQKPITTLFDKAAEKGVALIIRLPLASGLLSGKFKTDATFPEDDHRNYNRDGEQFYVGETFAGLPFEKAVELADQLKTMLPQGMTMVQFALRWVLDFEAVSIVIPGAKNARQVEQNCSASDLPPLGKKLHEQLKKFYEEQVAEHIRGVY